MVGARASYDAIRVYLWAGMTPQDDPLAAPLLKALGGMQRRTGDRAVPAERLNVRTGVGSGTSPYGFSAALLPYLRLTASPDIVAQQGARARSAQVQSMQPQDLAKGPPSYYDHVLSLFGIGWIEDRYRFQRNGQVQLKWQETCIAENGN